MTAASAEVGGQQSAVAPGSGAASARFRWLWLSQTVSLFGSSVGTLALGLLAAITAHGGPVAVGAVVAARYVPFIVLAVPAGALVDRLPHQTIMVVSDIVRALVMGTVVIVALTVGIGIPALLVAAVITGAFQVLFDTACQACLPSVVERAELEGANRRLQGSQSFADLTGPAFGGTLAGALGPPLALAVDAVSFLISAACLTRSGLRRPASARRSARRKRVSQTRARAEMSEAMQGVRYVLRSRSLRALAVEASLFNLLDQGLLPVFMLYALTELDLGAAGFGLTLAAAGVGTLAGALGSGVATRRWGFGRLLISSAFVGCGAYLLIPVIDAPPVVATAALAGAMFVSGVATGVANVQAVTLRQLLTPEPLLGRVTAAFRAAAYGAIPLGALIGGFLGAWLGLRPALWVLSGALLTTPLWLYFSPIRSVNSLEAIYER